MKTMLRFVAAAALVSSGCARGGLPPSPPAFAGGAPASRSQDAARAVGSGYRTIYAFAGGSDGAQPEAGLLAVDGALVGTTYAGGNATNCTGGCGTVFRVRPSGTEHVLHRFSGGSDGANPMGSLVEIGQMFYGTTVSGGASNAGTVFTVNPAGAERVLYGFTGVPDGAQPKATLLAYRDALYGTTFGGGNSGCFGSTTGCGTAFRVDTGGHETVLHRFGIRPDGSQPISNLIAVHGVLYGTTTKRSTNEGGAACGAGTGCGIVFAMTPSGSESTVYRFLRPPDASTPESGLVFLEGLFYGTTPYGGGKRKGTVYLVNALGGEQVVHSFNGYGDGANPFGGLIAVHGSLYGTTYNGGRHGKGTVFAINASYEKTVLHDFAGGSDGANPLGTLVPFDGSLYGTTKFGGAQGFGTVFQVGP
jgi:uncharacterized repeat protein (TIGR03803 family)